MAEFEDQLKQTQSQQAKSWELRAANSDEEHNASLIAFYLTFGDVMSTDVLITCI